MPELEQKQFQKRNVAYKVRISDILNSSLVKDDFSAGYIKLNNINISRINIIATIIDRSDYNQKFTNALIDDGTGRISLKSFENLDIFSKVDIGDVVLLIGKIREFNNEKYILPEILKKINNIEWMNVRKIELEKNILLYNNIENKNQELTEEIANINEEIYSLIKNLDGGDGAAIDDVIKMSNKSEIESMVKRLIEQGFIFEVKPGRVKVLE